MLQRWAVSSLVLSILALAIVLTASARYHDAPPVLAPAYTIRLTSNWPVDARESTACSNEGHEVLAGTLTRVDTLRYAGRLTRTSRLSFCGSHGSTQPGLCSLELSGNGKVDVVGVAYDAGSGPALRVMWRAVPTTVAMTVDGTCSGEFEQALKHMYLNAGHGIELPITPDVIERGPVRLDDYPWVIEVN